MPYVVSTLANSQRYTDWDLPQATGSQVTRPAVKKHDVLVKGGAHVQGALHTPEGVLTKITDDDAAFLKVCPLFLLHEKGGHVKITGREVNPDKVAGDMKTDFGDTKNGQRVSGGSAQLSVASGDFDEGGRAAGVAPSTEQPTI